jgi:hypothetical protein
VITGVWFSNDRDQIAVQLDGEEIMVTDYSLEPALMTTVDVLDLEDWRELVNIDL